MKINIRNNYKRLTRSLDEAGRRQLPFAFAKTLNQTMAPLMKYMVARAYLRSFDIRKKSFFVANTLKGDAVDVRKPVNRPWSALRGVLSEGRPLG